MYPTWFYYLMDQCPCLSIRNLIPAFITHLLNSSILLSLYTSRIINLHHCEKPCYQLGTILVCSLLGLWSYRLHSHLWWDFIEVPGSHRTSLWLRGKESICNAGATGDVGSIPGLGRSPGEGSGNPLQCSCLKSHGQMSLEGYNQWGCKELEKTEAI